MKIKFFLHSCRILLIIVIAWSIGCSSPGNQSKKVQITPPVPGESQPRIQPPEPPSEDIISDNLPVLDIVEKQAPYLEFEQKNYNLDLPQGGDIRTILLGLVKGTEFGIVIAPDVSGTLPVMDLKSASLKQILDFILPPLKLKYKWEGTNLHIFKQEFVTRYFKLDYVATSRKGTREVSFSTQSTVGGGSGGGGGTSGSSSMGTGGNMSGSSSGSSGGSSGGQNQSSSQISVNYMNTVWESFIESLKVLVFGSLENANASQSRESSGQQQSSASDSNEITKSFSYSDAAGKMLIITPNTGIVVVKAYEDEIERIAHFIETYEGSAQRQVWIEAKVIEVNLFKSYQMGIDWGLVANRGNYYGTLDNKRTLVSPAMTFTPGTVETQSLANAGVFQFAVSNNVLDVMIDAMARQGNLKVLASPRISTLNNEKAVIRVVREEAFFNLQTQISQGTGGNVTAPTINVQVIPIGIVMDIIPQIGEDGSIMLNVNPDISELLETRRFEVSGAMATQPVIDRRSIDTTAKLKNGQTLVIAGIIKERKNQVIKGVPFFYKLPVLGNLFRRTEQSLERTELVIFITPRIHTGKSARELSEEERNRVLQVIEPLKLGDVATIDEGLKGETSNFKKDKKNEEK